MEGLITGSRLYQSAMAFYDKHGHDELSHKVWDPTPWMLNVRTDGINSDRERDIISWCREKFGEQSWPIHGRPAAWYQGGATVFGDCWFGFATEEMMKQFQEKWGGDDA